MAISQYVGGQLDLTANNAVSSNAPDAGAYVNFLDDEGEKRIRAAYPGDTWARLAAVKGRYDPGNLFRLNQNIPPADRATG